jgi:thiosulfate dehydrogenase
MFGLSIYYPVMWLIIGTLAISFWVVSSRLNSCVQQFKRDPHLCADCAAQIRKLSFAKRLLRFCSLALTLGGLTTMAVDFGVHQRHLTAARIAVWPVYDAQQFWQMPHWLLAETDAEADLIAYGRNLIAYTQDYFGEAGSVRAGAVNGLNCQSCHLEAGTKPFGNNYSAVFSTYPQQRARSGALETIPKRVNDCFQRSLNGQPLDTNSREIQAIVAYIKWIGTGVPKGQRPKGAGLVDVPFLDRAADPIRGQKVYAEKCSSCHGPNGQGLPMPDRPRHYPPLWGEKSYNEGAGLFRMSRLAGYVKANMPFGATHDNPQLSDEETWDVAAFVNAQPRPKHPFLSIDWPKIEKKPFDHPFGPYTDSFPEHQHKYGPFQPIVAFYKNNK